MRSSRQTQENFGPRTEEGSRGQTVRWGGSFCRAVGMGTALAVALAGASRAAAQHHHRADTEKKPDAGPLRIPLDQVGAAPVAATLLAAGQSMLTLNTLDATHLLLTFSTHGLMRREPGAPVNDDSRNVAAEVIELPSLRIAAQTKWQLPDHAQYLWPIGGGRFVLRIGKSLSLFAPLQRVGKGDPFARVVVPPQEGTPLTIEHSPDGSLITVITELPPPKQEGPTVVFGDVGQSNAPKPTYLIAYFRVSGDGTEGSPLAIRPSGAIHADGPLVVPMDSSGYMLADEDPHNHWTVTFNSFTGKPIEAGQIDSSCPPRLHMVSDMEYLAITCRGEDTSPKLESMGLDGHETWEEPFSEFLQTPAFVDAPAAGRFAMERTSSETIRGTAGQPDSTETDQEVRVYQTESGDLLAHVPMSPIFRVPENFDLSPDGRTLAVLSGDEIDVYTLPAPSKRDMEDLAFVAKFAPPRNEAPVELTRLVEESTPAAAGPAGGPASASAAVSLPGQNGAQAAVLSAPASVATQAEIPSAATASNEPGAAGLVRKRPTLLNPGEVPEFKDKNAAPE